MKRTYKTIKINAGWVNANIERPGWQRNIYPARVNNFINKIRNGEFIRSLITVAQDKRTGKLILLDGQHKIEAIAKSEKSFDMDICIYEDIDDKEQMKVYKVLNDVKSPRLIDDIKTYIGKNDWLDELMKNKDFPISVTLNGGVNSIRIDAMLNVIYNGLRNTISRSNLTRKNLPLFLEEFGASHYALAKEFCQFYKECYGEPSQKNWMYKNLVMFTLFRIWNANEDNFTKEVMVECFKRIETKPELRQESYVGGTLSNLEDFTRKVYRVLNYHRSANYFIIFWDEDLKI